jgi:very-short-patch-repair endonuclease
MKSSSTVYDKLSKEQKLDLIQKEYHEKQKSFADIALSCGTYANKVRRDAIKLGIEIRDKSEAQKNALSTGKHKHPTKGTERSEDIKNKIGNGVLQSWENLDDSVLEARKTKCKENWEKMNVDDKANMQRAANTAVRVSSKLGSKLEKFILSNLLKDGFVVEFHKEQGLVTTRLQIDIFLPKMNTAIEIDGPSHFLPVWGEDSLNKNISYDQKKEGLILGRGWKLIRIKQLKDFSKARGNLLYEKLKAVLDDILSGSKLNKFQIED